MKFYVLFNHSEELPSELLPTQLHHGEPVVTEEGVLVEYEIEKELDASGEQMLDVNPAVIRYWYSLVPSQNEILKEWSRAAREIVSELSPEVYEHHSWIKAYPSYSDFDIAMYYYSGEIAKRVASRFGITVEDLLTVCREYGIPTSWEEYTAP